MNYHPIQRATPKRRVNAAIKSRYSLYKQELREDFVSKCGYCDTADSFSGGRKGFHIDHFAPKSIFTHLINSYSNLIYCCPICNIGKSNDWPSANANVSFVGNVGYVDPCDPNYHLHLARTADGKIVPLTMLGAYIHKKLKLNLKRRQICWLLEKMSEQLEQLREIMKSKRYNANQDEIRALCELQEEYFKYLGILNRE